MRAKQIMTRDVVTVKPETPVSEIARLMATEGISGVPVVDDKGCVVGIVSEDDLLLKHEKVRTPYRMALFGLWVVPDQELVDAYSAVRGQASAGDVMTTKVVTFDEDDDIDIIAETMVHKKINRVPIMSDCKIVGIITRADLLKAIAGMAPEQ